MIRVVACSYLSIWAVTAECTEYCVKSVTYCSVQPSIQYIGLGKMIKVSVANIVLTENCLNRIEDYLIIFKGSVFSAGGYMSVHCKEWLSQSKKVWLCLSEVKRELSLESFVLSFPSVGFSSRTRKCKLLGQETILPYYGEVPHFLIR